MVLLAGVVLFTPKLHLLRLLRLVLLARSLAAAHRPSSLLTISCTPGQCGVRCGSQTPIEPQTKAERFSTNRFQPPIPRPRIPLIDTASPNCTLDLAFLMNAAPLRFLRSVRVSPSLFQSRIPHSAFARYSSSSSSVVTMADRIHRITMFKLPKQEDQAAMIEKYKDLKANNQKVRFKL